jgi:hypothetical protein
MSQSRAFGAKAGNAKASESAFDWKEHQQKYSQTAKDMFAKFHEHHAHKAHKVDHEAVLAGHKKNLEALTDANKMAVEVMKSIAELQGQFVRQTFEDMNKMIRENMSHKPGEKKDFSVSADSFKNSMQKAVDHAGKVGEVLKKSGGEIHAHLKNHVEEHKATMHEHFAKYSKH